MITETVAIIVVIGTHERTIAVRTRKAKNKISSILSNPTVLVHKTLDNRTNVRNASKQTIGNQKTIMIDTPTKSSQLKEAQVEVVEEVVDEVETDQAKPHLISSSLRLQTTRILKSQDGLNMCLKKMSS